MKASLTLSQLTLLFFFTACDKESVTYEDKANEKYLIVAERTDSVYISDKKEWVTGDFLTVYGLLLADPVPENLSVKLNGTVAFNSVDLNGYLQNQGSSGLFETTYLNYEGGPAVLEISTSNGNSTCSIPIPPDLKGAKILPSGSYLKPGSSLSVIWGLPVSDAVYVQVRWTTYSGGRSYSNYADTLVTGSLVSIPGFRFKGYGVITLVEISGINGDYPLLTHAGNLKGKASGQFSCFGRKVRLTPGLSFNN